MTAIPGAGVARDDVAGAAGRPADGVARGVVDEDAVAGRCPGRRVPVDVGADEVAQRSRLPRPAGWMTRTPSGRLPEMTLRPGRRPADRVAGRAVEEDAAQGVAHGGGAAGVGADEVALHHVAPGLGADDLDAGCPVARDDVAGARPPSRRRCCPARCPSSTPSRALPRAAVPAASVPMKLPWIRLPVARALEPDAGRAVAGDDVARRSVAIPPMVFRGASSISTPSRMLPEDRPAGAVPEASVPMRLPWTALPVATGRRGRCPTRRCRR